MDSQATARHVVAQRSGGAFVHSADAAISWGDVIDYGDVALVSDAAHVGRQVTPAYVSTLARGTQNVFYNTATIQAVASRNGSVATGSIVAQNADDPGQKSRIARVLVPGEASLYCWLQRTCQIDFYNTLSRAEISHTPNNGNDSTGADTFIADRVPRDVEVWWATAQMLGDSASFPSGQSESWAGWSGGEMLLGHQLHADDVSSWSPPHAMYMNGGGSEAANILRLRTRRPTTLGQTAATQTLTNTNGTTQDVLWSLTGPPMREWLFFVHCCSFSVDPAKAFTRMWYSRAAGSHNATPVVDTSAGVPDIANYRNDYGCGPSSARKALVGYAGEYGALVAGVRTEPLSHCGDGYLRPSSIYCYPPTDIPLPRITIRSAPTRWHRRPAHHSVALHAQLLDTLCRRMVGL